MLRLTTVLRWGGASSDVLCCSPLGAKPAIRQERGLVWPPKGARTTRIQTIQRFVKIRRVTPAKALDSKTPQSHVMLTVRMRGSNWTRTRESGLLCANPALRRYG